MVYRGAPWKAEAYEWLSACWERHRAAAPLLVQETLSGKPCPKDCSGNGVCNHELGECRCRMGFKGDECTEDDVYPCNQAPIPEYPMGPWVVSICAAHCDTRTTHCTCGPDTRHSQRTLVEPCGFEFNPGTFEVYHGRLNKSLLFGDQGYCNVDAESASEHAFPGCTQCADGQFGAVCQGVKQAFCLNQCWGQGACLHGHCQCTGGFFGQDCSIPSSLTPQPRRTESPVLGGEGTQAHATRRDTYSVPRRRPLVYVYDLPYELTTHQLEGRSYLFHCAPWLYSAENATEFNHGWLYGMEPAIISSILASLHRTLDPTQADYFLAPVHGGCITMRADDSPRLSIQGEFKLLRSHFTAAHYQQALDHIRSKYPFWNRTGGRDHLWTWAWDEGACWAPESMWASVMLSHWGNSMSQHNYSTTAYGLDTWDAMPGSVRGSHPCFDPRKDVVMPAFKAPSSHFLPSAHRELESRRRLFYFNGELGAAFPGGRPEANYSMGIRQAVAKLFASGTGSGEPVGEQASADVVVTAARSKDYEMELASSIFCGVFPGDGFSARMEDAVLHGCIPVIIQDGVQLPFENYLDYTSFAVRIAEQDIPQMILILRAIPEPRVRAMLEKVRAVAPRWFYRGFVEQEAQLQTKQGRPVGGATEAAVAALEGDDAMDTLFQILGYKMHADPWRQKGVGTCF